MHAHSKSSLFQYNSSKNLPFTAHSIERHLYKHIPLFEIRIPSEASFRFDLMHIHVVLEPFPFVKSFLANITDKSVHTSVFR